MVTHRVVKQVIYAVVIVTSFFLVTSSLAISIFARPRVVIAPTPPIAADPLVVEKVDVVRHEHTVDAVARLRNPNARAGVGKLPVIFEIKNVQGKVISQQVVNTYILPGSLQYVVDLAVPINEPVSTVVVTLPAQPEFLALPDNIDLPNLGSFLRDRTTRKIGADTFEEQKGIVINNSNFDFDRVEVFTIALDSQGVVVGIGYTFAGYLKVGERREFTVQWPAPATATERVLVAPTTNSFKSENVMHAIGDPSSLQ